MNTIARVTLLLGALGLLASTAPAQTFGRNAVQYKTFHFKILKTQHFDVYFYDEEADAAAQAARMAERWYTRISTVLRHQLSRRQPLILYADHPAYNQTNIAQVEGSEGVTESLKRRILLPLGASPFETDHVIGHELTHAFQYDITGVARGNMAAAFNRVPLWFIEGMAEYVSLGNVDPNTTMWMRDAVRRGELPNFRDLENPRYFPYRWGQSFWSYLGGTYGDDIVGALLRSAGRSGNVQLALEQMTHRPADSLIADWHRALTDAAKPVALATGITLPTDRAQHPEARLGDARSASREPAIHQLRRRVGCRRQPVRVRRRGHRRSGAADRERRQRRPDQGDQVPVARGDLQPDVVARRKNDCLQRASRRGYRSLYVRAGERPAAALDR